MTKERYDVRYTGYEWWEVFDTEEQCVVARHGGQDSADAHARELNDTDAVIKADRSSLQEVFPTPLKQPH